MLVINLTLHLKMTNLNYDSANVDSQHLYQKIKQLEYENQDLKMQLQHNKTHSELQIQLSKESCENQLRMIKDDRENGLRLFKEEKEILQNHIDFVEKEKLEMSNVYKRKLEDTHKECDMEIEKLRQIQREAVRQLKEDHEDAIKRIRQMKDTELEAAMSATAHSRTIESVLNLIEDNTKNLDGLSQKVQMGHMINLSEHEIQIRNKEENLKSNLLILNVYLFYKDICT
jgi:Fas-binding factor 1